MTGGDSLKALFTLIELLRFCKEEKVVCCKNTVTHNIIVFNLNEVFQAVYVGNMHSAKHACVCSEPKAAVRQHEMQLEQAWPEKLWIHYACSLSKHDQKYLGFITHLTLA